MTMATVPTIELHRHPALRKVGIGALALGLAVVGAKGIYELADVLDGPGARAVTTPALVEPGASFGSADAAETWLVEEPGMRFGSPDAAERWSSPAAPEMGSADATEHWSGR